MLRLSGVKVVLASFLFVFLLTAVQSKACVNLGTYGATWTIKEKDALTQIMNAVKHCDWHKIFNKQNYLNAFHRYEERISTDLPRAKRHVVYTVDMTYTLHRDITDAKGNVIYPKGYTFNPLDYVHMPFRMVVINAEDKAQVNWFMHSKYYNKIKTMLLICKGDVLALEKKVKMPVFYADKRIVYRFHLKAVPSIIYQKGDEMYVEEIPVSDNDSTSANNQHTKQQ